MSAPIHKVICFANMIEHIFNQIKTTSNIVVYTSMHYASGPTKKTVCNCSKSDIRSVTALHQCIPIHRRGNARLPTQLILPMFEFAERQIRQSANIFSSSSFLTFFFITYFAIFFQIYSQNNLLNLLYNGYLVLVRILLYYFMRLQFKFNLYQLKFYNDG